jgi:hypothetical protein
LSLEHGQVVVAECSLLIGSDGRQAVSHYLRGPPAE